MLLDLSATFTGIHRLQYAVAVTIMQYNVRKQSIVTEARVGIAGWYLKLITDLESLLSH